MRAVELFAGVGGFRLGLERNGHEVVYANEWDAFACETYDKNFGGKIDRRDITTIRADEIPEHDLICGGFPCQAFSVAGKRRGFQETRGTLFFEICRIAQAHRTPYLFLENVKGLLSHDGGRTFETIIRTLDELGYDCQWQVLNSKDFGVPQNRERVFIIGHLRGKPRPEVFPLGENDDIFDERPRQVSSTITSRYYKQGQSDPYVVAGETKAAEQPYSPTGQAVAYADDPDGRETHPAIRRLTPTECERLQGFPDGWTEGVSDTQRYKQMGNAVTVNVIEAIAALL